MIPLIPVPCARTAAQRRLLTGKIVRHRAGSSRDTRVPLSLGNQSPPSAQAELPPAQLEMTAISLHLGRGGGVVPPGLALSGICCLPDTRANSCFAHGPQPQPASTAEPWEENSVSEPCGGGRVLDFRAKKTETGGDWEDVMKGHHDPLTLSLSRGGKRVQGPVG